MPDPTPEQIQQGETVVSYYTRLLAARDARIAELERGPLRVPRVPDPTPESLSLVEDFFVREFATVEPTPGAVWCAFAKREARIAALEALVRRMVPFLPEECRMAPGWKRGEGYVSEEEAKEALDA